MGLCEVGIGRARDGCGRLVAGGLAAFGIGDLARALVRDMLPVYISYSLKE
jgi:hypothetical protein